MKKEIKTLNKQVVGNIGMYYACYELSKKGWNVMPTSRNAKGIDILIYDQDGQRKHTIQVKSLSKNDPVPFGKKPNLSADFFIICNNVITENPQVFIATRGQINKNMSESGTKENKSYWLQPKNYSKFKEKWDIIGSGDS